MSSARTKFFNANSVCAFTLAQASLAGAPPVPPSKDQVFVVLTYAVLLVIWLIIAWEVGASMLRLDAPLGMQQTRRRLLTAGLLISLSLAWDSGYWLLATAARHQVITYPTERWFYVPLHNGLEKVPLIFSAMAFLWTFSMISTLAASEGDRRYFARFAERTLDAITVLDPQARIQYWNKSRRLCSVGIATK